MVDRISGGQTQALRGQGLEKARDAKEGGKTSKTSKTDSLDKRQAVRESGAQLRAHKQKEGQSFFQRLVGKKPLSPQQERTERRQRLRQQGPALAQHKKDHAQARAADTRDTQEKKLAQEAALREPSRRSIRGEGVAKQDATKQEVEVPAFKKDQHGMRDKLGALDAYTKLTAEGKSVRFVSPKSTLPQRSAILHEGRRSFFGQAGAKFKDTMLRIFRPQKWQERQVALSEARKTEWAYIKNYSDRLTADSSEKNKQIMAAAKDMEAIGKRSLEESVEKPQESVPRHTAEKLTYKSDPELLKNPDYVRERVQVLEEIAQKRTESESAAITKTREKAEAQLRAAQAQPATQPADVQPQPTATPRAPRTPNQTAL